MKKNIFLFLIISLVTVFSSLKSYAQTFTFSSEDAVVGKVKWTHSKPGDNFSILGRRFDVGYFEMVEANPGVDPALPEPDTLVVIPTRFIIPNVPHTGIVLNVAEMRVYYFPPGPNKVITYPVGIGRSAEWGTPVGVTSIISKVKNPTWIPPEDIREWHLATFGSPLPVKVGPGPDNPLGDYVLHLGKGFPQIYFHGTNDAASVGRRTSSGCIHLWPEDIEDLFGRVKVGTPVRVIDDPYKAGWLNNKVYLESHVPLEEQQEVYSKDLAPMRYDIQAVTAHRPAEINWDEANRIAEQQNGIPQTVGVSQ
jgi:L,D-transpeptidase ErfK/SrfK